MSREPENPKEEEKKNAWWRRWDVWTFIAAAAATLSSIWFGVETMIQENSREAHERYSDVVNKSGSTSPDIRMGGIYALEELNDEGEIDHRRLLEILTPFIRGRSPRPPKLITPKKKEREYCFGLKAPEVDIEAAMKVLARREIQADERPDLRYTELALLSLPEQAQLTNVDLTSADLRCSKLRGVNLENADLSGTWMTWADLTNANLHHAKHLDQVVWRHTTCPDGIMSHRDEKGIETCKGHLI
ncbi:pentapeptide repeat-containing protein [Streptomyces kronopolitis]|uniref:pentapeptide repeat-containing protein n=1 Tax=Streptomyces kronopolitis TaxID=1612435 RepID=UPI0034206809